MSCVWIAQHSKFPAAGRYAPVHLQAGPAVCPRNLRQVGVTVLSTAHNHSVKHLLLLLAASRLSVSTKLYTGHPPDWVAANFVASACCTAAVVATAVSGVLCCAEWSCGHDLCVVLYVLVQRVPVCKQLKVRQHLQSSHAHMQVWLATPQASHPLHTHTHTSRQTPGVCPFKFFLMPMLRSISVLTCRRDGH